MKKQAWIQDPKTANTAQFHLGPKSWHADPMYLMDAGRDAPPLLKTRSYLHLEQARELWRNLRRQGWKQVAPHWGADADV
jgi:hypothetical protein